MQARINVVKKILVILVMLCLTASLLCINAVAVDEPSYDIVIRVSGLKEDDTVYYPENCDYKSFAEGWEAAVDYACDEEFMENNDLVRIVVDFYADWNANSDGEFGKSSWTGFQYSTIYVPDDTRITINLNNHTINRTLKESEYDGEVMYVEEDADVIINNGTITGGWSCNGAGGIHITNDACVTLNNVNVVGNKVDDDYGAGIAVYKGASLIMNGGCVSNNESYDDVYGGGVYVDDATAVFTDVTFENNQGFKCSTHGAAVYVDDGTLVMEGCKVIGNGLSSASDSERWGAYSVISILNGSKVTVKDTEFSGNGYAQETPTSHNTLKYTSVISSKASYLTIEKCDFYDNNQVYLIESEATVLNADDSDFSENKSFAFYGNCAIGFNSAFTSCNFSRNEPMLNLDETFFFNLSNAGLSFIDCEFGDATFNNKSAAQFIDTDTPNGVASIFGDGLLAMIVALLALVTSVISIFINVVYNKKKTVTTVADNSLEAQDRK